MPVSVISNWYSGQNIFITGATGFMGKVLLEKLLRSCPKIEKIYILIRSKHEKTPAERLFSILDVPLFDLARKVNPKFGEKIVTITGDITMPGLGINSEDRIELINNVTIVFHTAATIRFDEQLKDAVTKNILAVQEMINLCYQMKKLEAFVHVSTAYSNCLNSEIDEKIYPSTMDVEKIMQLVQCLDNDILNEITPLLLKERPNTYTFTKELAEHLLIKHKGKLPIAIFRPSIVLSSSKEPFAGWIDNLNGPSGLYLAASKGILRSMVGKKNSIADLIPVDLAINCLICIPWDIAECKLDNIPIYNFTSGILNPIKLEEMHKYGLKYMREYPQNEIIWYPGGKFISSQFCHKIRHFIYHLIPAYTTDMILSILGRQIFMVKTHSKIVKGGKSLEYFLLRDWKFHSENVPKLLNQLNETDRDIFDFNIKKIDWAEYMKDYVLGIKLYVIKDHLNELPEARSNLKKMKILHYFLQSSLLTLFLYFVFRNVI